MLRATGHARMVSLSSQQDCISLALRAPWRDATLHTLHTCVSEAFDLSEYSAARARASCTGLTNGK